MEKEIIYKLLDGYRDGSLANEEKALLEKELLAEYYKRLEEMGNTLQSSDEAELVRSEMLQNILERIREEVQGKIVPMRRRSWVGWGTAAAILILVASSAYLYYFQHNKATVPALASQNIPSGDIAPGGNKAVLTLGNGQQIILDSAHNGQLAKQGATNIIKTDSSKLAYRSSGIGIHPSDIAFNTLTTPRGGQYQLQLPDGSKVWLNAASSIRYPTAFTGDSRKVEITGEAYFEVVHNTKQPFKVLITASAPGGKGRGEIEDIGTDFNINAYTDEPDLRTTILSGSVKQRAIILTQGEQSRVDAEGKITILKNVDIEQAVAWKNGLFNFQGADLKTVMRQLSRWYDVDVKYDGEEVGGHFNGEIGRRLTLSEVLKGLASTRIHFKIEGKTITMQK